MVHPGAHLPIAVFLNVIDEVGKAVAAVVGGEVPRALGHAIEPHVRRELDRAGREHVRGPVRRQSREVAHQRVEPRSEQHRLRVLPVANAPPPRRVGGAEEARVGVAQHAVVVDDHGGLPALTRARHVLYQGVEARSAVGPVDDVVGSVVREAERLAWRGAGDVRGEPGGRDRGGRKGGEERAEVGIERAATRVVRVTGALDVDGIEIVTVGCGGADEQDEEDDGEKTAVHGVAP